MMCKSNEKNFTNPIDEKGQNSFEDICRISESEFNAGPKELNDTERRFTPLYDLAIEDYRRKVSALVSAVTADGLGHAVNIQRNRTLENKRTFTAKKEKNQSVRGCYSIPFEYE